MTTLSSIIPKVITPEKLPETFDPNSPHILLEIESRYLTFRSEDELSDIIRMQEERFFEILQKLKNNFHRLTFTIESVMALGRIIFDKQPTFRDISNSLSFLGEMPTRMNILSAGISHKDYRPAGTHMFTTLSQLSEAPSICIRDIVDNQQRLNK